MIGVDTNVLLRHTLRDDARQSPAATAFLTAEARLTVPALISTVALIEFTWTLMKREGFAKAEVLALLDTLVASRRIGFIDRRAVIAAIESWRRGKADFPDYLIGHLNRIAGAATTMTFDEKAGAESIFSLLAT